MQQEATLSDDQQFDIADKGSEWHTAFYYFAEHVRLLTSGIVNHKALYSLVGTDGRYVNHKNPIVRKRTAGALSRIVHSQRYAQDMRKRYMQNNMIFLSAAEELAHIIESSDRLRDEEIIRYLEKACWSDVYRGLLNEAQTWRAGFNEVRVNLEITALFNEAWQSDSSSEAVEMILSSIMHILAFGALDNLAARILIDKKPTGVLAPHDIPDKDVSQSCLIKFSDLDKSAVLGAWSIPSDRLFRIGRYTDCDAVESDEGLSRLHCCIYRKAGSWRFEDMGSKNGSQVIRDKVGRVFDSAVDGARVPFDLQYGDMIVLSGRSVYWFGAVADGASFGSFNFECLTSRSVTTDA